MDNVLTGVYDIDRQIILELDPRSIISLCSSNRKVNYICENAALFHDLMQIYYPKYPVTNDPKYQFIYLTNKFGIIGVSDVDKQIVLKLDPESILNLCKSGQYSRLCKDETFFRQLIKIHYPYSQITNTPKRQFIAITSGVKTNYFIDVDQYTSNAIIGTNGNIYAGYIFSNDAYLASLNYTVNETNFTYPDADSEILVFSILGLQPNNGDMYWLQVKSDFNGIYVEVFLSKEEAINYFLNAEYDDILDNIITFYFEDMHDRDDINEQLEEKYFLNGSFEYSDKFKYFLEQHNYPIDITKQGLFDYIFSKSFFNYKPYEDDASDIIIYQFIPVVIHNEYK